jgi:hypothetical protein
LRWLIRIGRLAILCGSACCGLLVRLGRPAVTALLLVSRHFPSIGWLAFSRLSIGISSLPGVLPFDLFVKLLAELL